MENVVNAIFLYILHQLDSAALPTIQTFHSILKCCMTTIHCSNSHEINYIVVHNLLINVCTWMINGNTWFIRNGCFIRHHAIESLYINRKKGSIKVMNDIAKNKLLITYIIFIICWADWFHIHLLKENQKSGINYNNCAIWLMTLITNLDSIGAWNFLLLGHLNWLWNTMSSCCWWIRS